MDVRRTISCVIVAGLVAVLLGPVGCSRVSPGPDQVVVAHLAFVPTSVTVTSGTTVTWLNDDETAHQITANDGSFGSQPLNPGETFKFTFSKSGTFPYTDPLQGYMSGTVIVK